ncbi:type I polyketide synthase [Streptomyces sp. NPDC004539]|uniref:type I polyketide synthase n=1 Tax=Streptomyces sp. NPDC004539 TaxID=3154280 RepID=UPI0033ABED7A
MDASTTPAEVPAGTTPAPPRTAEPIAVVGVSCRLPGAGGPDAYWRLLAEGHDAVGEAPEDRWPAGTAAGHRRGGFIEDVDAFDAEFFGMPPYEAAAADPQQRLALELAWEALEHARIVPATLRATATGVFVGTTADDYATLHGRLTPEDSGSYALTGTQRGIVANRVSYLFGLCGPSMTIDTGQSSSLVAVHAACESLRHGGIDVALAGGVNLNLLPETTDTIARFGALSPDGRCHTFDSRANGYVRGEGGAFVVLKPLSKALADGDPVLSVILGGAVNNDGGGEGLTVPSAIAQADVVRTALARAGVRPEEVGYVELHGTGTPVGDPIEAAALGAVLGAGRSGDSRLLVGSVKTNIGHLEGAAGIAGLLKVVLGISRRRIPPTLHFAAPHPEIPLDELGLRMAVKQQTWPGAGRDRLIAGVSSFGMGGTNCHLVLAEPPAPRAETPAAEPAADAPWILTARSAAALRGQATALTAHLGTHPDLSPDAVAASLTGTRTEFAQRAVLLPPDRAEALAALAAGTPHTHAVTGTALPGPTAFLFPGQGSEWPRMARELLDTSPVFVARLADCADALAPFTDFSLLGVLCGNPDAPALDRLDVVQPALWAVMVSLAEVWRSHGVEPGLVVGHSQGEIAAATVTGALTLPDAARVVALRARAVARLAGRGGGMMQVAAARDTVTGFLSAHAPDVSVAVVAGPAATVVSGPSLSLAALSAVLEEAGHRTKVLPIDYASHSAAVEELREEILDALAPIRPLTTLVPFVSTVTGELLDTAALDAEYWYRNLREPVEFTRAVDTALGRSVRTFVECSPHPLLLDAVEETAARSGIRAAAVGTLRRDDGGTPRLLRSLAEAYVHGVPVRREGLSGPAARAVDLPTYAFQRRRHWLTGPAAADTAGPEAKSVRQLLRVVGDIVTGAGGAGGAVEPSRPFKELGLDSLGTLELRRRLSAATGLTLPASLTYDFPTPQRLAEHLHERLTAQARPEPSAPLRATPAPADGDPVVIVGMACRYPGGITSPEELWRAVVDDVDGTSEFPTNRGWDPEVLFAGDGSGTSYVRRGGFLHDADEFDGPFFGISPREALAMDPQQRLLLETSWEAMERAGIDPAGLRGSDTGVFTGLMAGDYGPRMDKPVAGTDGHLMTGSQSSVASGRIAYTFGFNGPALSVDTACSSSLVALHLAAEALRRGECSLALAGGVTLMSRPGTFVEFSRQKGLSPDGRCKPFSAAADGTAFAEGAGMLVVERLSDARRLGHRVLGVVRGSAVNQDGASNGLTAPNGPAQEQVIRRTLEVAGLAPADVDVVEAHGTGTQLGDPLEAAALIATYGQDRPAGRPLLIGSVKSNVGHTQAASGVAGVIKMVMAMRHGHLPAILHLTEPTPHVDWSAGTVVPLTEARPWPETGRPRRAAVSSFGISGTNAHAVIEEPPATEPPLRDERSPDRPLAWVLSAHTEASLRGQADRLHTLVTADETLRTVDLAHSLARTRSRFDHRAVVLGRGRDGLLAGLTALRTGQDTPRTVTGKARPAAQTAFLFTGQGGQRPGMGRELYDVFPVFAAAFDEVCAALDPHLDRPLREVMWTGPGEPLNETRYTQPALFAHQVAAFRLLASLGVVPDEVAGHSVGEIAAAYVSGVWDLPDAARMITARGRLMQALEARGVMVAVSASHEEVLPTLAGKEHLVGLGAVNGPDSVVISGDEDTCLALAAHWAGQGRRTKRLTVSHAFHSPLMEPMLADFETVLGGLTFHEPELPHVNDLVGTDVTADWGQPAYWLEQIRRPVMFRSVVGELESRGVTAYLEVGPRAVLAAMTQDCLTRDGATVTALHHRDRDETDALLGALAGAFTAGVPVDWAALADGGVRVDLPTYAFDKRRSWVTDQQTADVTSAGLRSAAHPMLRALLDLADGDGAVATGRLSLTDLPWLADHRMGGRLIVPGTAVLDLVLDIAEQTGCARVDELMFEAPLVLPEEGDLHVQIVVGGPDGDDGTRSVRVYSRTAEDRHWTRNATATVSPDTTPATACDWASAWPPAHATPVDFDAAYDRLAETGYDYGPAFRAVRRVWRDGETILAEIALADGIGVEGHGVHPILLDAALHPYVIGSDSAELRLPFAFQGVTLAATGATALRVRLTPDGPDGLAIEAADGSGRPVLAAQQLRVRAVPAGFATAAPDTSSRLYRVGWEKVPAPRPDTAGWAALGTPVPGLPGYADLDELTAAATRLDQVVVRCGDGSPHETTHAVLALLQRWLTEERLADTRLALVTRGAVATGPESGPPDPAQAAVWGLVRTAQSENPDRFVLVDLDGAGNDEGLLGAVATGEPQLALRDGVPRVPRLTRDPGPAVLSQPAATAWRLEATGTGSLDGLALVPHEDAERPLGAGEVRVAVRAAGLNFRDVMITLGRMEHDAGLGWELSGEVLELGPDVPGLAVGDRVAGAVPGNAFAPLAVVDHRDLARVPEGWSYVRAASVPLAYLTAYYALVDLADLKAGESVLIHAAAGGVGMAAVQVARHLGAEVFGTASAGKWGTLRGQGLDEEHIASSRHLDFEQQILKVTDGRGVDVVLDSLSGEFVDASLRTLADGGRFVEMGKTDIRDAGQVAADHPGVRYQAFDLHDAGPERRGEILAEVLRLFGEGVLTPLPVTTWDVRQAPEALRYLSQARHVGKVVLTTPREPHPEGTVLITGATGTLGRLVARHLVAEHGVRHLLLVGRRGAAAEGMPELAAELEESGATVTVAACDVADRDAVAGLLARIPAEHPLTGVMHAAGVLSDGVLGQLTPERVDTVLRPKTDAALVLDELTRDLDLARFVLFSSISGVIGNAGQGNYAAANAALDALAVRRARHGHAAVSVAWGLWAPESAMTASLTDADKARLAGSGTPALAVDEGLALLDAALRGPEPAVVASEWNLTALRDRAASGADLPAPLRGLAGTRRRAASPATTAHTGTGTGPGLAERLAGLPEEAARQTVTDLVRGHVSGALGYDADAAVDTDRAFTELGFDSLTSVELRNRLSTATGLRLPTTVVFDHPTVTAMSGHILGKLRAEAPAGAPAEASLDDVERVLRSAAGHADAHDGLVRILRRTLAGLDGAAAEASADAGDEDGFASDEELFAFLDQRP